MKTTVAKLTVKQQEQIQKLVLRLAASNIDGMLREDAKKLRRAMRKIDGRML